MEREERLRSEWIHSCSHDVDSYGVTRELSRGGELRKFFSQRFQVVIVKTVYENLLKCR